MDADLYVQILKDELQASLEYYNKSPGDIIFQQDNDPKHIAKRHKSGSKTMELSFFHGLHSL